MHLKSGRYYYVFRNKWVGLSRDYHDALVEYAKLTRPAQSGMQELLDAFIADIRPTVARSTLRTYACAADKLRSAFREFAPHQVKPMHVAQVLDHHKATPAMANIMRNVLKQAFAQAVRSGLAETNPVRDIKPFKEHKRDRYLTAAEFAAIRAQATPTLAAIMDVCYITGQRIGDVLAIRYADITDDGLYFKQQKTGNRLRVEMTEDLRQAVDAARALHKSVKGLTLFHTRQGKPFAYWTIRTLWNRATAAAGIEDAHIHDIRARAATDAKAQGLDSRALLGHTTEGAHNRYLRSKEVPTVRPVKVGKA
jgi:integrase